jgi:DNA-binding transcriptional LysR family regulator
MSAPRITLEQWRALQAVVEAGSYALAADALHKSQSTLTYAVQKIERLLGVEVFRIEGRKAVLTPSGEVLYRRAKSLLDDASRLERGASQMAGDWKPEIALAVEVLFPTWLLLDCLKQFGEERPETRVEVFETVMSGTDELLAAGRVDLAIRAQASTPGGIALMPVRGILVANPAHPLHRLGRPVTERDLRQHRRIFIRDSGTQRRREVEGIELRWTVSNKATSIRAVAMGLGYAWMPEEWIGDELRAGTLKPVKQKGSSERSVELFLSYADADFPGRDVERLGEILRTRTHDACRQARKR